MSEGDNTAVDPQVDGGEDIVITDHDLYQHAMSDEPASAPEPAAPPAKAEVTPEPASIQQARDEKGRFTADKTPAQPEPPKPIETAPQPQPKAPQAPQPQPQADHRVPLREYLDERGKRQELETKVKQLEEAFNYIRQNGFAPQQGPQGQPQPQPPNPQQLFEQPDQYLRANVIDPIQQWGTREMLAIKEAMSRDYAVDKYGQKVVDEAFEAMKKVRYSPDGDFAYRQIMASGNPYRSLVEWHRKERAHAAIGADPDAWLRQKQQEWLNDPAAQKAMVEILRQRQNDSPAAQPPKVSLPPSLSSIPAAAGRTEEQGDMSDASLFRYAMK